MLPILRCLRQGFFQRNLEELQRQTKAMITFEGLREPNTAFPLISFNSPNVLTRCKRMSDGEIGGSSVSKLDFYPATATEPANARFYGTISNELPRDRPDVKSTGFAAWRTLDYGWTVFGKLLWDVDPYNYVAIHFKSDGRKYFVNVQTESIVPTDIHQHRLYSQTPGEWETILIKWSEMVRTNFGQVVEPQRDLMTQKVRTIGIGLTDRQPGPFDLCISNIWATNAEDEDDVLRSVKGAVQGLPYSDGQFRKPRPRNAG